MNSIIIYVPFPSKKEALNISNHLLKKKLIACANLINSDSLFHWKKKLRKEKEVIALMKSKEGNFTKIKKEIQLMHSYELPAIIKFSIKANKEFEEWVEKECSGKL
ncbi:MAG: divalent-cation tolerance protein CutA [Candidatus Diapherotrites archaeon]